MPTIPERIETTTSGNETESAKYYEYINGNDTAIIVTPNGDVLSLAHLQRIILEGSEEGDIAANLIKSGPVSGGDAPPTFRLMVGADIPASLRTGADAKLVTGTPGAKESIPVFNVDGDMVEGADDGILYSDEIADSTAKLFGLSCRHWNNAGQNLYFIQGESISNDVSVVNIGGGVSGGSAAQLMDFYLAPNSNSGKGSVIVRMMPQGVYIGAKMSANSTLQVGGSLSLLPRTESGDTDSSSEVFIGIDDTTVARTVTILTADIVEGRIYIVKDESGAAGTNNITVDTEGAETIDGAATQVISTNYGVLRIYVGVGGNLFLW